MNCMPTRGRGIFSNVSFSCVARVASVSSFLTTCIDTFSSLIACCFCMTLKKSARMTPPATMTKIQLNAVESSAFLFMLRARGFSPGVNACGCAEAFDGDGCFVVLYFVALGVVLYFDVFELDGVVCWGDEEDVLWCSCAYCVDDEVASAEALWQCSLEFSVVRVFVNDAYPFVSFREGDLYGFSAAELVYFFLYFFLEVAFERDEFGFACLCAEAVDCFVAVDNDEDEDDCGEEHDEELFNHHAFVVACVVLDVLGAY